MKNITEIEDVLHLKPDELANITGCSLSTYYRYRNNQSRPAMDFFEKVLNAVPELNPEWLFKDDVPVFKKYNLNDSLRQEIQLYNNNGRVETVVSFPFYKLYNGGVLDAEGTIHEKHWGHAKENFLLNTRLFESQIDVSPTDLVIVEVNCHILAPELIQGTLCLVDITKNTFLSQGVYLIKIHHLIKMRRLQQLPSGNLRTSTNSPLYRDLEVDPDEKGFEILGKIVWIGRQI